jgi:glycosyltransferase involved in cell wall biosynthesis
MTSRSEGLPTILLEAVVLGRPVVAVDCPSGPREALAGGRHGRLVAEGDEAALVDGMHWALDSGFEPRREEMIATHDPDRIAGRYLELLRLEPVAVAPEELVA